MRRLPARRRSTGLLMNFRSYKQTTIEASIEYGEEVDFDGFRKLIDWRVAILFGIEFGDGAFLDVGAEDWTGHLSVRLSRPRKQSFWNKILGNTDEDTIQVKPDGLEAALRKFWPKEIDKELSNK